MLESEPGLGPVAAAGTAAEAVDLAARLRPAVAVVDYHLPDEDGLSLCLRLGSGPTPPAMLVYSAFADEFLVPLALIAGADALLSKDSDPDDLPAAALGLARGDSLLPQPSSPAMGSAASRLDAADLPILGMLAHGEPPGEIAATLGISEERLLDRRWAMLELLRGGSSARRGSPSVPA